MEHLMALWNIERRPAPQFTLPVPARFFDLAAPVAIGAAPGLLLVWLIPLSHVLPVVSIVSFTIACTAALFAHYSGIDRRAPGVTLWDIAAVFTLIWIGAGLISGPRHIVQVFGQLAMTP